MLQGLICSKHSTKAFNQSHVKSPVVTIKQGTLYFIGKLGVMILASQGSQAPGKRLLICPEVLLPPWGAAWKHIAEPHTSRVPYNLRTFLRF